MTHQYKVSGMTCNGCRTHVENALKNVTGVTNAEVDFRNRGGDDNNNNGPNNGNPVGDQTIVEIASSIPDFSILVDAVVKAGLVDALNNPSRKVTVFAPTLTQVNLLGKILNDAIPQEAVEALFTAAAVMLPFPTASKSIVKSCATANGAVTSFTVTVDVAVDGVARCVACCHDPALL